MNYLHQFENPHRLTPLFSITPTHLFSVLLQHPSFQQLTHTTKNIRGYTPKSEPKAKPLAFIAKDLPSRLLHPPSARPKHALALPSTPSAPRISLETNLRTPHLTFCTLKCPQGSPKWPIVSKA